MPLTRAELKRLKSLAARKGRREEGLFAAEGVRLLEEALRHGVLPERVYSVPAALSARGAALLDAFRARRVPLVEITPGQLEAAADTRTPQGVLGVFTLPAASLATLHRPLARRALLCEGVSDPGNLGTLLRSALAFDFRLVLLCGPAADPFAPKVVRASMGAVFALEIAAVDRSALLEFLEAEGFALAATAAKGSTDAVALRQAARTGPLALAVGAEGIGLSREVLDRARIVWRIDHSESVESLNAAVAGAIAMREVYGSVTGA